jgi:hypothetical protein
MSLLEKVVVKLELAENFSGYGRVAEKAKDVP